MLRAASQQRTAAASSLRCTTHPDLEPIEQTNNINRREVSFQHGDHFDSNSISRARKFGLFHGFKTIRDLFHATAFQEF
jgi:hypothetical protein